MNADAPLTPGATPLRIAVVDDDPFVLSCVAEALRYAGHVVDTYARAPDAASGVGADVDLVISDVLMPEMNGFELADALSRNPAVTTPRALLMSAIDWTARIEESDPAVVIGLLRKPFLISNLLRTVEILGTLRHRCPGTHPTLCAARASRAADGPDGAEPALCFTSRYTNCPGYAACGRRLRAWLF